MITRRGTPLVKKGDQVEKGDLLVSGLLPIYNDSQEIVGYEKTNASADVWIKYEENIEITIPRSQTVRHYTSKQVHSGLVLLKLYYFLLSLQQVSCLLNALIPM